ncbi:MAG: hypothetical protein WC586_00585 [Methanoregula sp.]
MSTTLAGRYYAWTVPAAIVNRQEHLSGRIRKKIARFEQTIAGFRQRRWS